MKRKLLLLTALVVSALTGMRAQTDVTSTWIVNPGFESCTASTNNIPAGKSAAGEDYESTGWKLVQSSAWCSSAVVEYGGSGQVNGASAPSKDNLNGEGQALGISLGWNGTNKYQSANSVNLPAGTYIMVVPGFNNMNGKNNFKSINGFVPTNGDPFLSTKTSFTYNKWEEDIITIELKEDTEGKFQIGGTAGNAGSGEHAKVFFDNIKLYEIPFGDGAYYFKNVGNSEYLSAGNLWGTQGSTDKIGIDFTIALSGNGYTFDSKISNGGNDHYFTGTYCDGAATIFTFEKVNDGIYAIKNPEGKYVTAGTSGQPVSLENDITDNAKWIVQSKEERINEIKNATSSNPMLATFLIADNDFGRNNQRHSSWIKYSTNDGQAKIGGDTTKNYQNLNYQQWNGNLTLTQNITDLPNGVYEITVQGFYRPGNANTTLDAQNAYLVAGSEQTALPLVMSGGKEEQDKDNGFEVEYTGVNPHVYAPNTQEQAAKAFATGTYLTSVKAVVSDGKLNVGVKEDTELSNDWTVFDNFQMYYRGTDELLTMLQEKINTANAIKTKPMKAEVKSSLDSEISGAKEALTGGEVSAILDATTALQEAIDNANVSIALYTQIKEAVDVVEGQESDASFKSNVDTKYDEGTYSSTDEVYTDFYRFVVEKLGTTANTDYTSVIVNNSFERGDTQGWTYVASYDHGAKPNSNNTYKTEGVDGNYLFNIWSKGNRISQTINSLPSGYYKIQALVTNEARVFIVGNNDNVGVDCGQANKFYEGELTVKVEDGILTIGAEGCLNNDARTIGGDWWYKADNFRLTYLGENATMSDEKVAEIVARAENLTSPMNATVLAEMKAASDALKAEKTPENYNTLEEKIEAAKVSIAAYSKANNYLQVMAEFLTTTNAYTEEARVAYYQQYQDKYDNRTLTNEEAKTLQDPNAITGWRAENNVDDLLVSVWDVDVMNWDSYHVNTWSNEGESDGSNFKVPFFEYWTGDDSVLGEKTMTATIEGLEPAKYKVTATVRVRNTNDQSIVADKIKLSVNDGEAVDVTSGEKVGESQFYLKECEAVGTVGEDGKLVVKFDVAAESNVSWFSFKNVKYEINEELATEEQLDALKIAITNAESKTLGFEKDEFAPYNNVEAIKALADAKAMADYKTKAHIEQATSLLENAEWKANPNEVNAIFDGSFEHDYSAQTGNVQPIGWYLNEGTYTGDGYKVRYMKLPDNTNESGYGLFGKFTLNYGKETGYTMPLKKGVYSLDFIYGGWNELGTREIKIFNEKSNAIVIPTTTVTAKNNQAHQTAEAYSNYSGKFIVPEDGDYVISFYRANTSSQNQIVISDIKIFIVPESSVSMSVKAGKYGTFIAPFDVTLPDDVNAYTVTDMDGSTLVMTPVEGSTLEANTAVVLENTKGENIAKEFFGKSVATQDTYKTGLLTGYYKPVLVKASTDAVSNYILQTQDEKQAFRKVTADYTTQTPNRAYLTVEGSSNVKAVFFPGQGDATGINAVSTLFGGDVEGIYTVGGAKVNSLQKGVNIIRTADGKAQKVLVK